MNQVKNIKQLAQLSYFDKHTISQFIDLSDNSLYANIKRWLKSGVLVPLKKGLYVSGEFLASQRDRPAYVEFIANKLRAPSYLSMEYVLQQHSMLTESVYGFTSVTLKSTRVYRNTLGLFLYRNMKDTLYAGYHIGQRNGYAIHIATKAKALFDYFYYKLWRIPYIDASLLETFRINYGEFSPADLREFGQYCARTSVQKFQRLPKLLGEMR